MKIVRITFVSLLVALTLISGASVEGFAQKEEKLTAEQVISRHLDSIGTLDARNSVLSFTAIGSAKAIFHGRGGGSAEGLSVLASKGPKYMVAMKFDNLDYPFEKMGYDGVEFAVGFVRPGIRSSLGSFLRRNESTFKTGIMSGVLSNAWPLLNVDAGTAKIRYAGLKKVEGRRLHALEYNPKKGSDLDITLYFDAETFQHVRTEYRRVLAARQGATVDTSAGQSETRYKMVEEYSNFGEENKLVLPHTYRIYLEILSGSGTTAYEWTMNLQKFSFNQPIDDKDFRVDTY